MGKGDQRSRRGQIWRGTFGKRRPKNANKAPVKTTAAPSEPESKPAKKKAAPVKKAETLAAADTSASDSPGA
jgi:30S ribosomal protein S31